MRLIDADEIVRKAEHVAEMWKKSLVNAKNAREQSDIARELNLFNAVSAFAKECSTIDPVKHGHWILKGNGNADCSCCGYRSSRVYDDDNADRYCRHCGARMDENIGGDYLDGEKPAKG